MKIILCQFDVAWMDKRTNYARVRSLLQARPPSPGALVVLPEMFATGFCLEAYRTRERPGSETEEFLKATAREHQVSILAGLVRTAPGGNARNEAVCFSESGREQVAYAKIHPFSKSGEHQAHVAGNEVALFDFGGCRVAPFICYDLRFPEVFRLATRRGAELFVVLANWPESRIEHWLALLRARAIENQAWVAGVNRIGRDPAASYPGRSLVVDPRGEVRLDAGAGEGAFDAEIDLALLRGWRTEFPALRDMRFA